MIQRLIATLQSNIDSLTTSVNSTTSSLQSQIKQEISDRGDADNVLADAIDDAFKPN